MILGAAACGNRLSKEEILAQNIVGGGQTRPADSQVGAADSQVGAADSQVGAADSQVGAADTGGVSGSVSQSGPGSAEPVDQGAAAGPNGGGQSPAQGKAGAKAPIMIGFVASLGGFFGPTNRPIRDAWVVWEKMVNARGGIKGHPVQLLIADDGGNESRAVSLVRDFVENKGAIAVSVSTASMGAVADYAESKSVPIIGSGVFHPEWNESPMLFPPYPNADGSEWGMARQAKIGGVTKVATLYCVEAAGCGAYNNAFVTHAEAEGLEVVYQGQISTSQPDYTAECLQMRNAGAEAAHAITEATSLVRMAQSCARQDYRPIWLLANADDGQQDIPEFEGAIGSLTVFPWFLRSGSPGLDEYVEAFQKYAPNRLTDGSITLAVGWLSAKTFEKAAASVSDQPTRQDILNGLWAMKGETLEGLANGGAARTFTRGEPTPETYCGFGIRMQRGKWVAPQGLNPTCR